MFLELLIVLFLVILGLIKPSSRAVNVLLIVGAFSLYALSYDECDRLAYMNLYDLAAQGLTGYELLYDHLMVFCNSKNLTFDTFRLITATITVVSINSALLRLTKNTNVVWSLYLIFSLFLDAILIRHSLCVGIALWLFIVLLSAKNSLQYWGGAYLLIVVSSLFHSGYWIFLPIPLIWKYCDEKKLLYITIGALFGSIVVSRLQGTLFSVFSLLSIREATMDKYGDRDVANLTGCIYNFIKYLMYILPVYYIYILNKKTVNAPNKIEIFLKMPRLQSLFLDNIIKINLLFSIILVPQAIAVNYNRFFRILLLLNYTYFALAICYNRKLKKKVYSTAICYAFCLLILLLTYEAPYVWDDVFMAHFNTNDLLTIFKF